MKYKVNLKGKTYEIEVEHGEAILLDEYETIAPAAPAMQAFVPTAQTASVAQAAPATASGAAAEGTQVTAPLPGNILSINVQNGQSVKTGDIIAVIEAMKMENEVLAPCEGTVKQIAVSKGAAVATGDLLAVI